MQIDAGHLTHIDAVGSLSDPGILLATIITSALLVFLTIKMLSLLLGSAGSKDHVARIVLILMLVVSYFGVAFLQMWIGTILHKEFHDIDPGAEYGLSVPIYPVWFVAALSGIVFVVARSARRRRQGNLGK
jgi:hypothetical protein